MRTLLILMMLISLSAKAEIQNLIIKAAEKNQIPEELLFAIVEVESHFKVDAINPKSNPGVAITSYGLGQLTKDTAEHHCKLKLEYIYDPWKNLDCSAKVLQYQLRRFGCDWAKAVSAYNMGTPRYRRGEFVNKKYVDKVFRVLARRYSLLESSKEVTQCLTKSTSK